MMYVRFPLSLRNVEDLPHERGMEISYETVRFWWLRFGPMFAAEICKRRVSGMRSSRWRWHLDEVFVRINGMQHYLWRAVDHEGEVLARCGLKGALGDAIFAVLCSCGDDIRKILAHLRTWLAQIIVAILEISRAMLYHRHGYASA